MDYLLAKKKIEIHFIGSNGITVVNGRIFPYPMMLVDAQGGSSSSRGGSGSSGRREGGSSSSGRHRGQGWQRAPTGSRVGGGDEHREAESGAAPVTVMAEERATAALR
jgi:hypothetical protein